MPAIGAKGLVSRSSWNVGSYEALACGSRDPGHRALLCPEMRGLMSFLCISKISSARRLPSVAFACRTWCRLFGKCQWPSLTHLSGPPRAAAIEQERNS